MSMRSGRQTEDIPGGFGGAAWPVAVAVVGMVGLAVLALTLS